MVITASGAASRAPRTGAADAASSAAAAAAAGPTGGPVPAKTTATSVTFVSANTAFVLGTAPCRNPTCTVILRTRDRGATWRGLPAPTEAVSAPLGRGLWGLRFADGQRGYAYGAGLWQTTDGGGSWRRATVPGAMVVAFAAVNDRELVAVTAACRSSQHGCANKLSVYHRPIASGGWTRVAGTGADQFEATIAVHGNSVLVLAGSRLLVSSNGGASFVARTQPCHGSGSAFRNPVSVAADGPHSYLLCVGQGFTGHTLKYLYRGGATGSRWTAIGRPPALGDGGALAAGSDTALVIATSSAISLLYHSTDGQHWHTARTQNDGGAGWTDLGFTTATDGVVIHGPASRNRGSTGHPGQLLLTGDGGRTWQLARF
jgi:hypothetical protein